MKTLYLECNMGAAGDMLMAALTELMPDKDAFVKELNDLQIPQVNIERTTIAKCGIMGTHMVVTVNGEEEKSIDVPMHAHTHSHVHGEHEPTLAHGGSLRLPDVDATVSEKLSANWSLERLDRTLKSILRVGTYELMARADVPSATVISEYVEIAKAFDAGREAGFVNGVLDTVAKAVRT